MNVNRGCLYTALSLAITNNAFAGQESDSMTVWSSPVSATTTTILGQDTIEKLDKQNVAQALSVIPGVVLQKSGNRNEQQVRVRGFDNRQVPIFFDGVPIYIPYDGTLDLGRFLTSDIASVEVSKGYSSLLQGPNQMGGAINITTKKPTKPIEGSIGYRQGWSRGEDNAKDMHASFGASNDLGYIQLSGSQLKQDFLGLPHDVNNPIAGSNGKMINSSADDKRGIVKVGFTPRANDEYTFTYINQDGQKDNPPYAGTSSQKSRYWQWPQYDKESYYYQGTTHLGDRFTLKSRLYRDTFQNTLMMYNSLADLQNKKGSYSYYSDYSDGAGLQLASEMRDADLLSFAVNWKDDVHREKGAPSAPYDRYEDRTWSLASEYQWQAMDNLDVVGGISYDWRDSVEGKKYEKNGTVTHYDANSQHAFNWQVMTKYHFENADTLSFSYYDRTRFPTLKERYTTSKPAYNQIALVNPQLKPERARGVDLTWNAAITRDWGLEASVYYNRVTDAILSHNIDADTVQNQNSGRVDYTGMDLGVKGNPFSMLEVGMSYGLIHADAKEASAGKITDLPTQTLTAWLTLKPWEPLSFTVSEEARSSSYSNTDGSQKAAGFAITHLRADYNIGYGVSVNASVNNLFDTAYAYSEGFIEEGRNYWLGMEYKF
ncbi:MAG: TonB-dependent receptor [Yokenella regensburgei]|jgi:iron complex outermembrane receptor protein|uniref:Iron complex outermembrane receptor protein n=1 Tax=Yokenella regensburgei TaxID=158877 RepID=A0ABX9RSB2_9ENTR|nr:TonB-dependent receptor [Yokenella regensburgei]MDQ4430908.1 TonB-dependent receptor [Yokenella regensburgei]MDR2217349.1 TonB-dependent receptor [Yokenella regensburgei]MDR3102917.1 TonB-dependent receptor [Yokenella regensburgei]RKR52764.1 iron complex outermembrane receptor protein [Yokenella regensburgei]VFS38278.1 Colicin I receptor precursor [Yokenella regensburgei]